MTARPSNWHRLLPIDAHGELPAKLPARPAMHLCMAGSIEDGQWPAITRLHPDAAVYVPPGELSSIPVVFGIGPRGWARCCPRSLRSSFTTTGRRVERPTRTGAGSACDIESTGRAALLTVPLGVLFRAHDAEESRRGTPGSSGSGPLVQGGHRDSTQTWPAPRSPVLRRPSPLGTVPVGTAAPRPPSRSRAGSRR